jgi:Arm domain-containing DNA-binding protein/integrase-like protein
MVRGHVRAHGAGWAAVVELERDWRTGRRRQKWVSGFKSKREAERAIPEILRTANVGELPGPTARETTATYLRHWLERLPTRGLRRTTVEGYQVSVEKHLIPRLGSTALGRLTSDQISDCYADLLSRGRRDGTGPLASNCKARAQCSPQSACRRCTTRRARPQRRRKRRTATRRTAS